MATGATQIEGSWYFFDYNNGAMYTKSGWVKYTDRYYVNGEEFTSSSTTNYYCTGSSGKLVTGWKKIGNYWFYFGDGEYQPSCAINTIYTLDDGSMFIFDSNGHLKTGWIEFEGSYYYSTINGCVRNGWKKINNKWYYFDSNGIMVTGWYTIYDYETYTSTLYHFADDGHCLNP